MSSETKAWSAMQVRKDHETGLPRSCSHCYFADHAAVGFGNAEFICSKWQADSPEIFKRGLAKHHGQSCDGMAWTHRRNLCDEFVFYDEVVDYVAECFPLPEGPRPVGRGKKREDQIQAVRNLDSCWADRPSPPHDMSTSESVQFLNDVVQRTRDGGGTSTGSLRRCGNCDKRTSTGTCPHMPSSNDFICTRREACENWRERHE